MFQNQTQVGTALQVFYNLGLLVSTVNEVVRKVKEKLASCVQEALDHNTLSQAAHSSAGGPGRAAMPTPGNTAAWRATLWTRMEQLMDSIFSACGQVNMYMFIRIVLCSCIMCILFFLVRLLVYAGETPSLIKMLLLAFFRLHKCNANENAKANTKLVATAAKSSLKT